MNTSTSRWRIVICQKGEEPRAVERVWLCLSYWHSFQMARRLLDRTRVWPSQFVVPPRRCA